LKKVGEGGIEDSKKGKEGRKSGRWLVLINPNGSGALETSCDTSLKRDVCDPLERTRLEVTVPVYID
jgi:hypothetical protein